MKRKSAAIVQDAEPRQTAQVRLADGRVLEAPVGTPVEAYFDVAFADSPVPVIAALVNGELRELAYPIQRDSRVDALLLSDSDGVRIYRRSLSFLLVAAVRDLFPDAQIFVEYSLPFGGFFCQVRGRAPFSVKELAQIETHMRRIVAEDTPIIRERVPLDEAIALFNARGEEEKVNLLLRRRKDYLILYNLRSTRDYFHGYMVPSTKYLRYFALYPHPPGFVLQYPRRHRPTELLPRHDYPQLTAVFREYGEWLRLLGVDSVSALNDAIANDRIREVILVSEALHEERIARIAGEIVRRKREARLVLVAGPSASGKTSFSKRLAVQLLAHGARPFALELDNYFVDREQTPRDENGEYDFESLGALDVPLFNQHLLALMNGEEVQLTRFNFHTGQREPGKAAQLGPDHIIIIEGIHGLNPQLVPAVPEECIYRVYVSALTQLNIDRHNRVPTTDTRLLRRIVRDATYRGYSAEETLNRWESVRRGEKWHIFPYQENADVMFNSALAYELAILKPLAEPLLLQVEHTSPRHVEAKRLLTFLRWVEPCGPDLIPDNSLLREFVGGSILRDYAP
ncbi:MAG: nucleoside kinase [Anaerolineae bacterium]|nr:nucleoside kinase [Anaerolineae bacterium]